MNSGPGMTLRKNLKREKDRKNWKEKPSKQEAGCAPAWKRKIRKGGVRSKAGRSLADAVKKGSYKERGKCRNAGPKQKSTLIQRHHMGKER